MENVNKNESNAVMVWDLESMIKDELKNNLNATFSKEHILEIANKDSDNILHGITMREINIAFDFLVRSNYLKEVNDGKSKYYVISDEYRKFLIKQKEEQEKEATKLICKMIMNYAKAFNLTFKEALSKIEQFVENKNIEQHKKLRNT